MKSCNLLLGSKNNGMSAFAYYRLSFLFLKAFIIKKGMSYSVLHLPSGLFQYEAF